MESEAISAELFTRGEADCFAIEGSIEGYPGDCICERLLCCSGVTRVRRVVENLSGLMALTELNLRRNCIEKVPHTMLAYLSRSTRPSFSV